MPRVLVPLAEGFEEIEAVTVVDLLRRAGVEVQTAALAARDVTGSHGITIRADTAQLRPICSTTSEVSSQPIPCPPCDVGRVMPTNPASFIAATLSHGYCSVRSISAARSRRMSSA